MLALLLVAALGAEPESESAKEHKILQQFRWGFIVIEPGVTERFASSFDFGDLTGKDPAALPVQKIKFARRFAIAKFETPQNLWELIMKTNPSRWKGPRNAVEMVTYADAVAFCQAATKRMRGVGLIQQDEEIRLPSETEWEYCCRAGTKTLYSFGNDTERLGKYAWFTGNAAGNDPPGGAKELNPWSLADMHGYIREWCADTAAETLEGFPTDGSPRRLGPTGTRVVRGGSWKDKAELLASSARMFVPADTRDDAIGFRCVLANVPKHPPEFNPTAQNAFIPAGAKLELLWGEGEFTEGPAVAPDGSIFFSDIGNAIYRFDPAAKKTAKFRDPSGRSNGMMFNRDGALVVCEWANTGGGRRISLTTGIKGDQDGEVKTLSAAFDGKAFNSPNDLAIGPDGWVYFTDPRYVGNEPRELDFEGVFAIGPDGKTQIATRDIEKPNGIIFAPDGKRVYVADNNPGGNKQLAAYQCDGEHRFTGKQVLWDFGPGRGIDGMSIDREGNVFATAGTGDHAGIYVFSPQGKPLAFLPTPGDPTNCCFGRGEDGKTLYVTAATSNEGKKYGLFRISVRKPGFHVSEAPTK